MMTETASLVASPAGQSDEAQVSEGVVSAEEVDALVAGVMQAYLNLRSASTISADAWCATLLQHMKGCAETRSAVDVLFEGPALRTAYNPLSPCAAQGETARHLPHGPSAPAERPSGSFGASAGGVSSLVGAKSAAGGGADGAAMTPPTEFNSFLICKWHAATQTALLHHHDKEGKGEVAAWR
jgi:hypothetical protein